MSCRLSEFLLRLTAPQYMITSAVICCWCDTSLCIIADKPIFENTSSATAISFVSCVNRRTRVNARYLFRIAGGVLSFQVHIGSTYT
jgi:hypothetical protein